MHTMAHDQIHRYMVTNKQAHIHCQGSGVTRRVHNILVQLHGLGYYDKKVARTGVQQCVDGSFHLKCLLHCPHTTNVVYRTYGWVKARELVEVTDYW